MEFTYKSAEAISELSADEQNKYLADKRAYEDGLQKQAIEMAVKEAKDELAKEIELLKDSTNKLQKQLKDKEVPINPLQKAIEDNLDSIKENFVSNRTSSISLKQTIGTQEPWGFDNFNPEAPNFTATTYRRDLVLQPFNQFDILNHVSAGTATAPTVTWFRQVNEEGNAEFIGEGQLKPLADFDVEEQTDKAKKIAVRFRFLEEYLQDVPRFMSIIERFLNKLVTIEMRRSLISGTGVGSQPLGFINYASAYVASDFDQTVANPDNFDVVGTLSNYLTCLGCTADTMIVNCADYSEMINEKDGDGRLLRPNFNGNYNGVTIIPVPNDVMVKGDFLLYDSMEAKVDFWSGLRMEIGRGVEDFERNRWTVLLEARLLSYVEDPCGFIYDNFLNVKTLIAKA